MTKQEFEKNIGDKVTEEQYKKIEFVYTFHPAISEVTGKDQITTLYKVFGMSVIMDMIPRAEKAKSLEDEILKAKAELKRLTDEFESLRTGAEVK